jgi:hypothetical protein
MRNGCGLQSLAHLPARLRLTVKSSSPRFGAPSRSGTTARCRPSVIDRLASSPKRRVLQGAAIESMVFTSNMVPGQTACHGYIRSLSASRHFCTVPQR